MNAELNDWREQLSEVDRLWHQAKGMINISRKKLKQYEEQVQDLHQSYEHTVSELDGLIKDQQTLSASWERHKSKCHFGATSNHCTNCSSSAQLLQWKSHEYRQVGESIILYWQLMAKFIENVTFDIQTADTASKQL